MRTQRFSLIEILVVVSIIVILAGMVLGVTPFVKKTIRVSKTKAQIAQLRLAFEMYHEDWGYYPQQPANGEITAKFLSSIKKADNNKPYYKEEEFNFDASKTYTSGGVTYQAPVDGFSQPFYYRCPGTKNTTTYDLWSMGPDGKHGGDPAVANSASTGSPSSAAAMDKATDNTASDNNDDIATWKKIN